MSSRLSRRNFLKGAAATAALNRASGLAFATTDQPSREVLQQFEYADVKLTGGPLKQQYDRVHAHYLALDNDRLLKVYRQRAGLPAPGEDMGGWYDLNGFVPGHTLGQYISGLARIGASTRRRRLPRQGPGAGRRLRRNARPGQPIHPAPQYQPVDLLHPRQALRRPDRRTDTLRTSPNAKSSSIACSPDQLPSLPAKGHDRIGKKDPPYDETFVMPENLFTATN